MSSYVNVNVTIKSLQLNIVHSVSHLHLHRPRVILIPPRGGAHRLRAGEVGSGRPHAVVLLGYVVLAELALVGVDHTRAVGGADEGWSR